MVLFEVRPQKEDTNHTRITVAGSRICYPGGIGRPTDSLDLVKLMINSVLSCHNTCFVFFDAETFYLKIPMYRPEYVRIKLSGIP